MTASASSEEHLDVVVIGGGQAGLATGYYLARHGLTFVILDEHSRVGDAWRNRWEIVGRLLRQRIEVAGFPVGRVVGVVPQVAEVVTGPRGSGVRIEEFRLGELAAGLDDVALGQLGQRAACVPRPLIEDARTIPDGRFLVKLVRPAVFGQPHEAVLWPWRPEDLRAQICSRLVRDVTDLTVDERREYFGDPNYPPTCPRLAVKR